MSASRRNSCLWSLALILGLLSRNAAAQQSAPIEPGFGAHYREAAEGMCIGGGVGLVFGFAASAGGKEETMLVSMSSGTILGMVLGSAYYANTITPRHEAEGSFLLDVVGSAGTTVLATMLFASAAQGGGSDGAALLVLGGIGAAVPLGSVMMQRMVAGSAPQVAAWHPAGSSPKTMGMVVSWGIR